MFTQLRINLTRDDMFDFETNQFKEGFSAKVKYYDDPLYFYSCLERGFVIYDNKKYVEMDDHEKGSGYFYVTPNIFMKDEEEAIKMMVDKYKCISKNIQVVTR